MYIDLNRDGQLSSILLNLTMYKNLKLKTEALRLVYCLHSQANIIKSNMEETILLDGTNTKISYNECNNLSQALKRLGETADKWFPNANSQLLEVFQDILDVVEGHILQPQTKAIARPVYTEPVSSDEEELARKNTSVPALSELK